MLVLASTLVIAAILIGNAAYESGNISGAGDGAIAAFPSLKDWSTNPVSIGVAVLALLLLATGRYKLIERFLIGLVCLMGVSFFVLAVSLAPPIGSVIQSIFMPSIPKDGLLFVLGLIGTTVVPYNLFLHASASKERWQDPENYDEARLDTILSIAVGGLITAAILISAATVFHGFEGKLNYATFADQLEANSGYWAKLTMSVGLMAAGLSSAIAAPLAAGYATTEVLGLKDESKRFWFRVVWFSILALGTLCIFTGYKPAELIVFAQVANGLILPVISLFLLWVMNDREILGDHRNRFIANLLGGAVVLVTMALGARAIWMKLTELFTQN